MRLRQGVRSDPHLRRYNAVGTPKSRNEIQKVG